jgi:hypothetical protein
MFCDKGLDGPPCVTIVHVAWADKTEPACDDDLYDDDPIHENPQLNSSSYAPCKIKNKKDSKQIQKNLISLQQTWECVLTLGNILVRKMACSWSIQK